MRTSEPHSGARFALLTLAAALIIGWLTAARPSPEMALLLSVAPLALLVPDVALWYIVLDAWLFDRLSVVFHPLVTSGTVAAAFWVISRLVGARDDREALRLPKNPVNSVLVVFMSLIFVSYWLYWHTVDPTILNNLILFILIVLAVKTEKDLRSIAVVAVIGATILSFSGVFQLATDGFPATGLTGFLSNHVQFGLYILLGIPFTVLLARYSNGVVRGLLVCAAALQTAIAVLSLARGVLAVGAILLAVAVAVSLRGRQRVMYAVAILIVGVIVPEIVASSTWFETVFSSEFALNGFLSGRIPLLVAAWRMFLAAPVFGMGYRTFPTLWSSFAPSGYAAIATYQTDFSAHSTYLQILAEIGVVGFLLYVSLLVLGIRNTIYSRKLSGKSTFVGDAAIAVGIALLAMGLHGVLDNSGWHDRIFYVLLGLSVAIYSVASPRVLETDVSSG